MPTGIKCLDPRYIRTTQIVEVGTALLFLLIGCRLSRMPERVPIAASGSLYALGLRRIRFTHNPVRWMDVQFEGETECFLKSGGCAPTCSLRTGQANPFPKSIKAETPAHSNSAVMYTSADRNAVPFPCLKHSLQDRGQSEGT